MVSVAENVLKKEQLFNGVTLQLKPWIMENSNDIVEVLMQSFSVC